MEALSLFRFHLSPFPQKRLILRLSLNFLEQLACVASVSARVRRESRAKFLFFASALTFAQ